MARKEAEDIRSSQQRARHTEKRCMREPLGREARRGEFVEVVETMLMMGWEVGE
jgi:hypothetical protein